MNGLLTHLQHRLSAPVDSAGLAYFRIAFGALMVWESWRFLRLGWVERYFSGRPFYFTYWPFDWIAPWPVEGMYLHLVLTGLFALFVALGFMYRVSAVTFLVLISSIFLLEKARYLNHLYLICLLAGVLAVVPAHRSWSIDAWLWPSVRAATVPAWTFGLLLFQLAVPMTYAGIAKLNADWLRGEPMLTWLAWAGAEDALFGPLFSNTGVGWVMVYGAILIDLCFLAYISNRRTRVWGFGFVLLFHFLNARIFGIGVFPWMMIASTTVFFGPAWPRRMLLDLRALAPRPLALITVGALTGVILGLVMARRFDLIHLVVGALGVAVFTYHLPEPFYGGRAVWPQLPRRERYASAGQLAGWPRLGLALLLLWVGVQLLLPMRHYLMPGNVSWNERGHHFAWHMLLRDKDSWAVFWLYPMERDPALNPDYEPVFVNNSDHLTDRQEGQMAGDPEMIWQYAQYLDDWALAQGLGEVRVHAEVYTSLNGRPSVQLVNLETDLSTAPRPIWGRGAWVLPLTVPLNGKKGDVDAGPAETASR